ncbi:expressed unknown protein [Seminavis robusta]|uniref:Uncharacterized protein n=1 Tax=Seminavis robusta TaxID=568900 RepID=A0A9N8H568_9STRA|nr:expressed unknown protein [Seminavis robusta]|eukprot:Sro105_g053140.1 n/a (285) ;mRNA; f:25909-26763
MTKPPPKPNQAAVGKRRPTVPRVSFVTDQQKDRRTTTFQPGSLSKVILEDLQSQQEHIVLAALEYLSGLFSPDASPADNSTNKTNGSTAHRSNCQHFFNMGGHGVLLVTMKRWSENAAIQSSSCECLARFIHGYNNNNSVPTTITSTTTRSSNLSNNNNNIPVTDTLLEMGIVELILGALERFPHSPTLHYRANNVLRYLDMKRLVDDFEGVTMVLKIMTTFPNVASLQELGCRFLQTSLQLGFVTAAEIRSRAILVIVAAVTGHPQHKGIKHSVGVILKRVSS